MAFDLFVFETSYQDPFQVDTAYNLQPNTDVPMTGREVDKRPEIGSSRRDKYEPLDWNAHKATIKDLSMNQNKTYLKP